MKKNSINRRDFIKKCAATAAIVGVDPYKKIISSQKEKIYDAKGLPQGVLGKTRVKIPMIVFGAGSRFCTVIDPEKSVEILHYALDHGFYYWDTAHDYVYNNVVSEERIGLALKGHREKVFLSTKVSERSYDGAMRHVEESLKRLQTSRVDLLQIHSVSDLDDVDKIGAKNGVLKALHKLRDEKVTRFIGYSGHTAAEPMRAMAERYDFDTMLIALNHQTQGKEDFENHAIPFAAKKKMGVLAMKVIRPRETVEGVSPEELIQYALSLQYVDAAVIGTDSLEVLKKNISLVKKFKAMTLAELIQTETKLKPFFENKDLPWMRSGYRDGHPV